MTSMTADKPEPATDPVRLYAPPAARAHLRDAGINPESLPHRINMDVLIMDGRVLQDEYSVRENILFGSRVLPLTTIDEYHNNATSFTGDTAPVNNQDQTYMLMLYQAHTSASPVAHAMPRDDDPSRHVCVIMLPTEEMTARYTVNLLSGVPEEKLPDNLPGTDQDWARFILAHEMDHCVNREGTTFQREVSADRAGLDDLRRHFNETQRPEMYDAMSKTITQARSITIFSKMDFDHATGIYIDDKHDHDHSQTDHHDHIPPSISGDAVDIAQKVVQHYASHSGQTYTESIAHMDETPGLFFNVLKQMNHQGTFDAEPMQKKLIDQYLSATEELSPDYHADLQKAAVHMPATIQEQTEFASQKPTAAPGFGT